jgi:hypothetical protein
VEGPSYELSASLRRPERGPGSVGCWGGRGVGPQNPKDLTRDTARDLSALVGELAALKGDATHWLTDPDYAALRYRLEAAHAAAEAALVVQRSTYQRSLIGCLDCETREEALARRVTTAFK